MKTNKIKTQIYCKDSWGIIFKTYYFLLQTKDESLIETYVTKKEWDYYQVGDKYVLDERFKTNSFA
jgi:hypothetical protein